jgi:hypothetical protein
MFRICIAGCSANYWLIIKFEEGWIVKSTYLARLNLLISIVSYNFPAAVKTPWRLAVGEKRKLQFLFAWKWLSTSSFPCPTFVIYPSPSDLGVLILIKVER